MPSLIEKKRLMSCTMRCVTLVELLLIAGVIMAACGPTAINSPATPPTTTPVAIVQPTAAAALSEQQTATLNSLEKVDDFPLYTMHCYGSTRPTSSRSVVPQESTAAQRPAWACSLFAALGGVDKFYGRASENKHSAGNPGRVLLRYWVSKTSTRVVARRPVACHASTPCRSSFLPLLEVEVFFHGNLLKFQPRLSSQITRGA